MDNDDDDARSRGEEARRDERGHGEQITWDRLTGMGGLTLTLTMEHKLSICVGKR